MTTSKMTLILILQALTFGLFSQGTIPNQGFEAWLSNTAPKNWQSTTDLLPPGYITCQRITASQAGKYAIQLSTIDLGGWKVPGVITLGEIGIGYTAGGIGFTGRPEALKGFLMHPSSGDQVLVAVQFYRDGVEIGGGSWTTSDSIPDYQEFSVPVNFSTSQAPDTMNITILTDQNMIGSTMMVDGLYFEYATTGMKDKGNGTGLKIYPNPCSRQLIMEIPQDQIFEATIYDLDGTVMTRTSDRGRKAIDTSGLPSGAYVLTVNTASGTYSEKVFKQ